MGSAYLCTFAAFLPTFSFLGRAVSSLAYVQIAVFSPALSLPSFFHTQDAFFCYILQSLTSSQALLSAPLALSFFFSSSFICRAASDFSASACRFSASSRRFSGGGIVFKTAEWNEGPGSERIFGFSATFSILSTFSSH